jgi:RNA polymerase sigma-70 factor (ECF subfamily)
MVSLDQPAGDAGQEVGKLVDLLESSDPNPFAQANHAERRAWIRQAMDALPEHLRSVVQLVYYQGLKYREAAEALSVPVGTVKSRLHAAILKLNELWQANHEE